MIQRGSRLVFPSPTFNAGSSLEVRDLILLGIVSKVIFSWGLTNCKLYRLLSLSKAVKSEKANIWYGTPTMYVDMLAHPDRNNIDFDELR